MIFMDASGNMRVMTDDENKAYDEAMRQGHYLTGLDIALKAQARDEGRGTSDEEVYAPIMDKIFWWHKTERDDTQREA